MKTILCCFILFAAATPVWAQDFSHFTATNSYSWTTDGFDFDYKEVTVPLTDNDSSHTFTKLQHWHIPFDQIASVDFANTGGDSDVAVAVMLKSEIAYSDTESSYQGDKNVYTDHSIVCYIHYFKSQQDGLNFINQIKQHLPSQGVQSQASPTNAASSQGTNPTDLSPDDTSWSGKKIYTLNGYHADSAVLEGSNISIYHYFYSQPASDTVPGVPADPYDYDVIPLKNVQSVQVNGNDVVLNMSTAVQSYFDYAQGKNHGDFEKVSVSNYTVSFSSADDAQHFAAYLNHHSGGGQH